MKVVRFQLIALVLTLFGSGLWAQNSLRVNYSLPSKCSVIRAWKADTAVVSVYDGSSVSRFILESAHNNQIKVVDGPAGFKVTDFRVFHDSVFFCGSLNAPHNGVFGFFDIADFFNGTGVCHYCVVPIYISPSHVADYFHLAEPHRMDVFSHDGVTHIAFVGRSNLHADTAVYPRTTVGDICCSGNMWTCTMLYNKDGRDVYTDIAANDDYVVAVAIDDSAVVTHVKPYYASGSFLYTPLVNQVIFRITDFHRVGRVCVESVASKRFALAYQFTEGGVLGSTLKTFGSSQNCLGRVKSI